MLRASPGEDVGGHDQVAQFFVRGEFELGAGQGRGAVANGHPRRNSAGRHGMIACDHLDANACGTALGDRFDRLVTWRIDDADQRHHGQPLIDVVETEFPPIGRGLSDRQSEYAPTAGGDTLDPDVPGIWVERSATACRQLVTATGDDRLGRSFDEDETMACMVVVQGGHQAVFGFKRNHVAARVLLGEKLRIESRLDRQHDQRHLGRVALEMPIAVTQMAAGVVAQQRDLARLLESGALPGL